LEAAQHQLVSVKPTHARTEMRRLTETNQLHHIISNNDPSSKLDHYLEQQNPSMALLNHYAIPNHLMISTDNLHSIILFTYAIQYYITKKMQN